MIIPSDKMTGKRDALPTAPNKGDSWYIWTQKRQGNDQGEQNEPITGYYGIQVFSLVEGREGKSSGMSNEVRRGRRTSGDDKARGPAQHPSSSSCPNLRIRNPGMNTGMNEMKQGRGQPLATRQVQAQPAEAPHGHYRPHLCSLGRAAQFWASLAKVTTAV